MLDGFWSDDPLSCEYVSKERSRRRKRGVLSSAVSARHRRAADPGCFAGIRFRHNVSLSSVLDGMTVAGSRSDPAWREMDRSSVLSQCDGDRTPRGRDCRPSDAKSPQEGRSLGPMNGACSVESSVLTVHLRRCRRDSAPYDSPPRFPRSPRRRSAEEWAPNPFDILSGELARSGEWPMTSSCACSMPMCWASFALLWLRHV